MSRTHRVALDWLFDRINLDPKIQIKHADTKNRLADIPTKGNFTRDEWNHLLRLFNHKQCQLCQLPSGDVEKNSRRNRSKSNRGKVKTDDEFGFEDSSKIFNSAEFKCIKQPGDTQSDQSLFGPDSQYGETRCRGLETGILVARSTKGTFGARLLSTIRTCHQATSSSLRKPTRTYEGYLVAHDEMEQINSNAMIWRLLSATMKAAVHLGNDYQENLRTTKSTDFNKT